MGAERTLADYPATNRSERTAMLALGGLRKGDVLLLRAMSDLGRGAEVATMQAHVERIGATIEVVPVKGEAPKVKGRKPRLEPTEDQKGALCGLWWSPQPADHVLQRAAEIMGAEVDRHQMRRWCGRRDAKAKRGGAK